MLPLKKLESRKGKKKKSLPDIKITLNLYLNYSLSLTLLDHCKRFQHSVFQKFFVARDNPP